MAHKPIDNLSTEKLNKRIYFWFVEKLSNYYLTAYRWNDFPFDSAIYDLVIRYLNLKLMYTGVAGFTYENLENNSIPIVGGITESDAKTWFGASFSYDIITETHTIKRSIDDVAICYNNPYHLPFVNSIYIYSDLLTKIYMAMRVNFDSQNTPAIIRAPHGKELTYSNMFEQVAGHKPVVFARDDVYTDDKDFFYLQPGQFVADKLWLQMTNTLNMFFFELGASPLPFEKKAQIQTEEVNITKQPLDIAGNVILDGRVAFCKRINERFGLNTSVDYNFTGEYVRKQIEAIINSDPYTEVTLEDVQDGRSGEGNSGGI